MQKTCQHRDKVYLGIIPCTGKQVCRKCGKEFKRERLTEKEYQASLQKLNEVFCIKGRNNVLFNEERSSR